MKKDSYLNSFYYLFGFKKINKPIHFLLVITAHVIGWLIFFSLPLFLFRIEITDSHFWHKEVINKLFLVAFFYFNYFLLIPFFLIKGKRITYLALIILSTLFLFGEQLLVERKFLEKFPQHHGMPFRTVRMEGRHSSNSPDVFFISNDSMRARMGPPSFKWKNEAKIFLVPRHLFFIILTHVISSAFVLWLLGAFIYLLYFFIKGQDEKKSLENAGLKAEINLLKTQINPHFLFNTLNSIYVQAYQKSAHTDESILKLSEILRYMIYDTGSEQIDLEKDIHYLTSYIDLQRMRLAGKVTVDYSVKGNIQGLSIAPLLLIIFIENAFKHGISYAQPSVIMIHIEVFDKTLTLRVSNPIITLNKFVEGGIGLKNVKRRLELLYPGNYWLDISNDKKSYVIQLKINLTRD